LLCMTLVCLSLPFLILSPTNICNFITIWMVGRGFNIYKQADVKGLRIDHLIFIALCSLIYFPFIVNLLLLLIALILFRAFIWREWITPILGFAVVYFLLGVIYYWIDRFDEFIAIFSPFANSFPTALQVDIHDYFVGIPIGIDMIFFLFILQDQYFRSI